MTPVPTLSFSTALITGGAGGLGKAMAADLISRGKTVILAGRTESSLRATANEIGAAAYYVLDTGDIASLPSFISRITHDHPGLDCLINNAGVQRPFQILGPDYTFDLSKADQEIDINIRGPLHLCVGLIQQHFSKLPDGKAAVIMNVSSVLGFNPSSVINPVYNGTKAFLHFFTLNLRSQLAALDPSKHPAAAKIKIVEIAPPTVETDLHRERTDPDDNKKAKGSKLKPLSLEEFMDEVGRGWEEDREIIAPGWAGDAVGEWEQGLGRLYSDATKAR